MLETGTSGLMSGDGRSVGSVIASTLDPTLCGAQPHGVILRWGSFGTVRSATGDTSAFVVPYLRSLANYLRPWGVKPETWIDGYAFAVSIRALERHQFRIVALEMYSNICSRKGTSSFSHVAPR